MVLDKFKLAGDLLQVWRKLQAKNFCSKVSI